MRVLHKHMLKQFPQNVLVCVWRQELRLLVALGLQEIQVLFPRDQGAWLTVSILPTCFARSTFGSKWHPD